MEFSRVFQTNAIFESLTVSENIAVSAVFGTNKSKTLTFKITNEHEQILEKMIEMFDLGDITNQIAANISIVERKKLMFSFCFSLRNSTFILDEPVED